MMIRLLTAGLVCVALLSACAPKNTAQETEPVATASPVDPVDRLRLPQNPDRAAAATGSDLIDPARLDELKKPVRLKRVVIEGDRVPLRAGPGARFNVLGTALKGDSFTLLGTQADEGTGEFWYLAEDERKNKVFIASPLAHVAIDSETPGNPPLAAREQVQTAREPSDRGLHTVFDPTPPLPSDLKKARHITLNFEGTELYDVITTFSELLKIDYLIEGTIQGKVTLQTFNKIPVEDLYSVLEQILALHNVAVVKSGNFYRFLPAKDAAQKPLAMYYGSDPNLPARERMVVQVVPLRHVSPETMQKIITPLLTKSGSFIEVPETRNLMMVEMAYNVGRILKVVQALDIDKLAASDIQLYRLHNADAEMVVEELNEIFSSRGYKEVLGQSLTFLALPRLNSVLSINTFKTLNAPIDFWMSKLDEPVSEGTVSTFVYYVQNAAAVEIADLLTAIFPGDKKTRRTETGRTRESTAARRGNQAREHTREREEGGETRSAAGQTAGGAGQTTVTGGLGYGFEGETTIIPDESTNSLIIRTSPRNYPPILELVKQLDLVPQQVLIEVLILDLTLDDSMSRGIEWFFQSTTGNTTIGGGSVAAGSTLAAPLGAAGSFPQGGTFFIAEPGRLQAQLKLLASDSKTNILANPILVTSDNRPANISIAEDVPIASTILNTTTANPTTSTSVEFRSVGIKLDITPKINSENFVNLAINQEISSVAESSFQATGAPSFLTRVINTEVVLKDNEVLVMGGLIRNQVTESHQGVPVLKDIPLFGELFGSRSLSNSKTELVVFIAPHVISNAGDAAFVTSQLKDRLGNLNAPLPGTAAGARKSGLEAPAPPPG